MQVSLRGFGGYFESTGKTPTTLATERNIYVYRWQNVILKRTR